MSVLERINTFHFADAKLFLEHLRSLAKKGPSFTYFRGQSKDLPLVPTACRGNGKWTGTWIENFVESNRHEYVRFLDHFKWEQESQELFQLRFELALRNYIEHEIVFQFQQLAINKGLIDLSANECAPACEPNGILGYLQQDKIPLAQQTRYAELLAQHHGVPTRLLDWTSCLNVALDFAVSGVSDPTLSNGRIVVWVVVEWGRKVPSADPDCDEQRYHIAFTETGEQRVRLLMEKPLYGTCLKMFSPPSEDMNEAYFMQNGQQFRLEIDRVHEVYVNDQKGNAMIDVWHDRNLYRSNSFQSFEARLSETPIPKDKVFKLTLPHSEIPWLLPQLDDIWVPRIYDLPMYEQYDGVNPPADLTVEKKRSIREHNFLTELGERLLTDIDWDELRI